MTWLLFAATAAVIVSAGIYLARYGDVIGEKSGLGRTWIGVVLLAATTSLPELITGFSATALSPLPNIAIGNVLGACMVNFLILSLMDAIHPERLSARAYQGHALSIAFGVVLLAIVGFGLVPGVPWPTLGWVGFYTPLLLGAYFVAMRVIFSHEQQRRAREVEEVARELEYERFTLRQASLRYAAAAVFVIGGALALPGLGATIARDTGLGEAFVGSVFIAAVTCLPEIVVSVTAVRLGALDLGIGNVLGSNLFNLFILALDDVFYRPGPLLATAEPTHAVSVFALVVMNGLFLVGLTHQVLKKRFIVAWDTGAIALVYGVAVWLTYRMHV